MYPTNKNKRTCQKKFLQKIKKTPIWGYFVKKICSTFVALTY